MYITHSANNCCDLEIEFSFLINNLVRENIQKKISVSKINNDYLNYICFFLLTINILKGIS